MLGVSKLCSPRPKARDVLLSWARASAYDDRAVECLKWADLAPDPLSELIIAFARHYRTLAQIERRVARETSPQTRLSQSPIDQNRSGSLTSFALVLLIIISGATTTLPLDLARASDCLTVPNSPAPKGSHWYYHLNRATQQKCWYVRSSGTSLGRRRRKQLLLALPCRQQALGRSVRPEPMTLIGPRASPNRLPPQYRNLPLVRCRTDRHPSLVRRRIGRRPPLYEKTPRLMPTVSQRYQPRSMAGSTADRPLGQRGRGNSGDGI